MDNNNDNLRAAIANILATNKDESPVLKKGKLCSIKQGDKRSPIYINDEQRQAIQNLFVSFYRVQIVHEPELLISQIEQRFLAHFKVRAIAFITIDQFDEIVRQLVLGINRAKKRQASQVNESNVDYALPDDFVGFALMKSVDNVKKSNLFNPEYEYLKEVMGF